VPRKGLGLSREGLTLTEKAGLKRGRKLGLLQFSLVVDERHAAECSCGWSCESPTKRGARVAAAVHVKARHFLLPESAAVRPQAWPVEARTQGWRVRHDGRSVEAVYDDQYPMICQRPPVGEHWERDAKLIASAPALARTAKALLSALKDGVFTGPEYAELTPAERMVAIKQWRAAQTSLEKVIDDSGWND
jgi:hypothetical protein